MSTPILETNRLLIRPYTEHDTEALFPILSDPLTMAFWPAPFTREQTESWLQRSIRSYESMDLEDGAWNLKRTTY